MKIKNVVIINDFDYVQGGASKVAIDTANLLIKNKKNLNVYFFSGCHDDSTNLNEKIISICTNQCEAIKDKNKMRGILNGIYNFKAKKELKILLKSLDKNNTIIHVHGWTKCLSSSIFHIIFKMNFKVVLTMHDYFTACPNGGYFNFKNNSICHYKPMSLKCIFCNCDSRNYLIKIYRIIRQFVQNKIVKLNRNIGNVISISDFSEKIVKKTLNKNTKIYRVDNPIDIDKSNFKVDILKNKYFLFVGRISKEKGVDIFCEAISKLKLPAVIVGDGKERETLENEYPNIDFVGWKNSDEVKEYIKKAKALVFPSKLYEGAPLTTKEALALGIPCIVSDNCAARDLINDNNGLLFNIEKKNLSDVILKFLNSQKKYDNIKFELSNNYVDNVYECYNEVINN